MVKNAHSWFQEGSSPVEAHLWWVCSAKFNWASMADNDTSWRKASGLKNRAEI
jgi:hypothetical protein